MSVEVFVNNTNLTFLIFVYKISIEVSPKKIKLNFVSCNTSLYGLRSFLDSFPIQYMPV